MHDIAASQEDRDDLVTRLEDADAWSDSIAITSPQLSRKVALIRAALQLVIEQAQDLAAIR
jgi:hypothetical protein